jgi:hypothetical protein
MLVFSLFLMNVSVGLSPDDEKRTELVLVACHFCDRLMEGILHLSFSLIGGDLHLRFFTH